MLNILCITSSCPFPQLGNGALNFVHYMYACACFCSAAWSCSKKSKKNANIEAQQTLVTAHYVLFFIRWILSKVRHLVLFKRNQIAVCVPLSTRFYVKIITNKIIWFVFYFVQELLTWGNGKYKSFWPKICFKQHYRYAPSLVTRF